MTAAAAAMHLSADHEKAAVGMGLDCVFERLVKARPAGAAVEFGGGIEERLTASGAMIDTGIVNLVERAGAGALGAVLAQHPVLRRVQPRSPFLIAVLDLEFLMRDVFRR